MRYTSGAIDTLAAAWDDVANTACLLLSGTEGHAAIIDTKLYVQCKTIDGADGKSPYTNLPPQKPAGFDAFLDAVAGKDATLVTAREAAYRSAVIEAMYDAAKQKKWVSVKSQY